MDEHIEAEASRLAAENGGISNTIVRTDQGVMVVNLWENEEGMEKVGAAIGPMASEAGIGERVGWRMFEVLRQRRPGG
jgi:hypothetical protein